MPDGRSGRVTRSMRVGHPRWWLIAVSAVVVVGALGLVGTQGIGPTEAINLHSLTAAAQQEFYLRFRKPGPTDFAFTSRADAIKLARHADPEGLPVREVVLARAHRVDGGPPNDSLCWVVVMTFGQTPPVSAPFVIVLIDAHTSQVVLQGGAMAGP
jgi:hypothetical protein